MNWLKEQLGSMDKSEAGQHYLKYADMFSKLENNIKEYEADLQRVEDLIILEEEIEIQRDELFEQLNQARKDRSDISKKWGSNVLVKGNLELKPGEEQVYWEMFQQFLKDLREKEK